MSVFASIEIGGLHAECFLDTKGLLPYIARLPRGAIAQLGERLHGMQEVGGSIPPSSTTAPLLSTGRPHRLEA